MAKRKNLKGESVNVSKRHVKHGTRVSTGKCCDCAQGIIGKVREGFEYFDRDNDGRGFWFCCYCGSNHVTVVFDGLEIEQDNLYDDEGCPNF
jgi:hypothetical protein